MTDPAFPFQELNGFEDTQANFEFLSGLLGSALPQAGDLKPTLAANAPSGWLLCDGSAVSRTVYAALFAEIGTIGGPGDGSTTFNLPDYRDRVLMGASGTYPLGSTGGEASHTLTSAEMPSHSHTASVTDPGHAHTFGYGGAAGIVAQGGGAGSVNETTSSNTTGISVSVGNSGSGGAHNNLQPYGTANWVIKT